MAPCFFIITTWFFYIGKSNVQSHGKNQTHVGGGKRGEKDKGGKGEERDRS